MESHGCWDLGPIGCVSVERTGDSGVLPLPVGWVTTEEPPRALGQGPRSGESGKTWGLGPCRLSWVLASTSRVH